MSRTYRGSIKTTEQTDSFPAMADPAPWMRLASCLGMDRELFFAVAKDDPATRVAQRVCRSCQVQTPCLQQGIDNHEYGVWGGTTENERKAIRRKAQRNKGRAA